MEDKIKELRTIVHQLSNDFSGVKALVDLTSMGLKKELDIQKVKQGLDKVHETIDRLKNALRSE